jgi:hypothetical protein
MLTFVRGLRGRRGLALVVAAVLGLLALGGSTAAVVALAGHRSPPSVAVGTRPLPPAPSTGASALTEPVPTGGVAAASSTAAPGTAIPAPPRTAGPSPVATPTPPPAPPPTVRVDENTSAVTIRVGTLLDVELHGDPGYRWSEPDTPTPALLQRLSGSAEPATGDARATFRALAAGDAVVMIQRSSTCSSGPTGGVCAVEARRIAVTVTS